MLRRLKIKFVCINMLIVTLMLCIIFGLVLNTTKSNLEQQSIQMMQTIAVTPTFNNQPGLPAPDNVRLPFFTLHLDQLGRLIGTDGSYFDLSDEELLKELAEVSFHSQKRVETLDEYSLRYYRLETPFGQSILISHRLANVVSADNIYVLDKGIVAESGSHGELLTQNGTYARLWNAQQELEAYTTGGARI